MDREIWVDSRRTLTTCGPSNDMDVNDVFGYPGSVPG